MPLADGLIIRICGHDYQFHNIDPGMWSGNGIGRSDIRKGLIQLRTGLTEGLVKVTMLHEVIHQIIDIHSMEELRLDNEISISVISASLYQFMKDNPAVAAWLSDYGLHD